ncbi:Rhodanese-like domain-containing protein 14 [Hibiscus syriacus]|uniref:Rhodanese-like domain-containing protein 14 n=1 Tax=Hibiscus syriacus TaxID=106335 RepID=A0A6A2ZU07_HIBSY|nr:rhodanese-like domain-containing protein 14, chloroplastic [Hibiscus syriacus]KAE8694682.1 Rhodanese-like domain-containing protein 14 [Hibiscus syriacus]
MAALASITPNSTSSSSVYPNFRSSPLTISSKITPDCSCLVTLRSGHASKQRLASQTRRGLIIRCAATKPAKSPAEEEWKVKRELLLEKRVRSVDAKEAFRLQKENNFVILDVRPEAEFKEAHPTGAVNIQIYRLIKEWTAWDIARRAAFAFFGIFSGTEENPEFIQGVESKFDKDAKIIVACTTGGTMKPSQNLPEGQQSRSLIAAYLLVLNGYKNVFHLEGGLYTWFKEELPSESED